MTADDIDCSDDRGIQILSLKAIAGHRKIVGDHMATSWVKYLFLQVYVFTSELRDYILGHVRSLKSLDMIREYIWKDCGVNWR